MALFLAQPDQIERLVAPPWAVRNRHRPMARELETLFLAHGQKLGDWDQQPSHRHQNQGTVVVAQNY
jgi:hypothetical protein